MNTIANPGGWAADFSGTEAALRSQPYQRLRRGIVTRMRESVACKAGITEDAIQTAVRYAAIIHSVAVALEAGGAAARRLRTAAE